MIRFPKRVTRSTLLDLAQAVSNLFPTREFRDRFIRSIDEDELDRKRQVRVTFRDLTRVLNSAGQTNEIYITTEGSKLLLLQYGARVLGLSPTNSDENFYWTNP